MKSYQKLPLLLIAAVLLGCLIVPGIAGAMPAPGSVNITSTPAGAVVAVDGQVLGTIKTPVTLSDIEPGYHTVEVTLAGHQPWSAIVQVTAGEISVVPVVLTPVPPTGTLNVTSSPSGAVVYVDGTYQGRTPELISVSPGAHTVLVQYNGYENFQTTVQAAGGAVVPVAAALTAAPPMGTVSFASTPSGARIYLDGVYMGVTPAYITAVIPGKHVIELELTGYYDRKLTINVPAGNTYTVSETLTAMASPTAGSITVASTPSGAYIYLDGAFHGKTPASDAFEIISVTSGTHTIGLELEGYLPWSATVQVPGGTKTPISASLTPLSSSSAVTPDAIAAAAATTIPESTPAKAGMLPFAALGALLPAVLMALRKYR